MNNTLKVLNALYDAEVNPEYCSPNFVSDFAVKQALPLSSDDVVFVSDTYGESHCPTGRSCELEHLGYSEDPKKG